MNISVIVGENGAGKSQLLDALAHLATDRGQPVLAVANTVFERFSVRGAQTFRRLSARHGRTLPKYALKQAMAAATEDGLVRLRSIPRTLQYCGYQPALGVRIVGLRPERLRDLDTVGRREGWSTGEMESVESAARRLLGLWERLGPRDVRWFDFDSSQGLMDSDLAFVTAWESHLRKLRVIWRLDLALRRKGAVLPLNAASSGELSLIASLAFLVAAARPGCLVLIDEPENSLHPQWQKEYLPMLADLLYRWSPQIVIATHSPLIVSGARHAEVALDPTVYLAGQGRYERALTPARSVEGLFWESFRTVTPENHYLSERITDLLTEVDSGEKTLPAFLEEVGAMEAGAYDKQQSNFFSAVRELAARVAGGSETS